MRARLCAATAVVMLFAGFVPATVLSADSAPFAPQDPVRFVAPEELKLLPLQPHFTPQEARTLADLWVTLLSPTDTALSTGAVDLLQGAPTSVSDAIAARLEGNDALDRVVKEGGDEVRSRILNSPAMNVARLRDYAPSLYSFELNEALTSRNVTLIASFAATAQGFRHLPPLVVNKVVAELDKGDLEDQARHELFSMLLGHDARDCKTEEVVFKKWLDSAATDDLSVERRNVARTLLLAMGADLSEKEVQAALESSDPAQNDAAATYLQGPHGTSELVQHLVKYVNALLVHEQNRLPKWIAVHQLLASKAPAMLATLHQSIYGDNIAKVWADPAFAAEWVKRAEGPALALVATSRLDLYDQSSKGQVTCNTLRYRLAVLGAKAETRQPTIESFWRSVVLSPHECRETSGDAIDEYLAKAAQTEDINGKLTELFRRSGAPQLAEWKMHSTRLSQALSEELERRLAVGDATAAKQLLLATVQPSATRLEQMGFWSTSKLPTAPAALELYFRAAQAAGSAPRFVVDQAAKVASDDTLDPEVRAYALMAIASDGQLTARQDVFNAAISDKNPLVARAAIILLSRSYDAGMTKAEFKLPNLDVLGDAVTRRELDSVSDYWISRLAPYDPKLAQILAEQSKWANSPSEPCFVMAAAKPTLTIVGVDILNAAPDTAVGDELRACAVLLFGNRNPIAVLARNWNAQTIAHPEQVLRELKTLRQDPEFASFDKASRTKLASLVALAAPHLPYNLDSQQALSWWAEAIKADSQGSASQVKDEHRKRVLIAAVVAIPGAIFIHLALWAVLLLVYPKSPSVQAVVFWNPIVRKLLGLGYMDLVLLYVPLARRRLFAPFRDEFLRDAHDPDDAVSRQAHYYYGDSQVRHRPARVGVLEKGDAELLPITTALARPKGRVLLLGKSGLGKSTFLKHCLRQRTDDVAVYLRADQCRAGVEAEISSRMQGIGSDLNLLKSAIYAGRLWVYIDGYNEVDLATQDAITTFLGGYPHGNILIASQISLRGFTGIETYELTPLERQQIQSFLVSRTSILPIGAVISGDTFKGVALAFLQDTWAKSASEEETKAFEEVLANPMDLTSVALLLSQGGVPDVFALERQQFDAVVQTLRSSGVAFRTIAFSQAVFKQRLEDQEDLEQLPFKPEVTGLIGAKLAQMRTFSDPAGSVIGQEVRFRHDRIRDFFTHFSLLEATPEEQVARAQDARFAGVFPYLARSLPAGDAEALRESLITLAAHIEDHRVSDSFIREYSWRQRFASKDPDWMLEYDLPSARAAEAQYEDLAQAEKRTQKQMQVLRDEISKARRLTRILTTSEPAELMELVTQLLLEMGATRSTQPTDTGRLLLTPDWREFLVVPLAQTDAIRQFHVELLAARVQSSTTPLVVVTNWQTPLAPDQRAPGLGTALPQAFGRPNVASISCSELYDAYRVFKKTQETNIWQLISSQF